MNKNSNNENQWQPCDEGRIRLAGESIHQKRQLESRRQFLRNASTAAVAVVGVGFAGWTLLGPKGPNLETPTFKGAVAPYGGITCKSVVRLLPDYIAMSIEDEKVIESIEAHLEKCGSCRHTRESMAKLA